MQAVYLRQKDRSGLAAAAKAILCLLSYFNDFPDTYNLVNGSINSNFFVSVFTINSISITKISKLTILTISTTLPRIFMKPVYPFA